MVKLFKSLYTNTLLALFVGMMSTSMCMNSGSEDTSCFTGINAVGAAVVAGSLSYTTALASSGNADGAGFMGSYAAIAAGAGACLISVGAEEVAETIGLSRDVGAGTVTVSSGALMYWHTPVTMFVTAHALPIAAVVSIGAIGAYKAYKSYKSNTQRAL